MSFSSDVKEELYQLIGNSRHCQMAELAAILHYMCREDEDGAFFISMDHEELLKKSYRLLLKLFHPKEAQEEKPAFNQLCTIEVLQTLHLVDQENHLLCGTYPINNLLIKQSCCKRALLRGMFLCCGSVSNPEKGYHLELVLNSDAVALQMQELMQSFDIEAKITRRKKYTICYIKEGEGIVNFLNVLGAFNSLMELENLRILKEISNSVNRQVNCETANINKAVEAGTSQVKDIKKIQKYLGFENLPANLCEIAELRLEHPDVPLKELGAMLEPPIGKSGVNHRLRKLSEIASTLPDE